MDGTVVVKPHKLAYSPYSYGYIMLYIHFKMKLQLYFEVFTNYQTLTFLHNFLNVGWNKP
jgi:hypothetical protein